MCTKMCNAQSGMRINQAYKFGSGIAGSSENGCANLFHAAILRIKGASAS